MRSAMRGLLLVVTLAYDFNDPDAPHTSMAINLTARPARRQPARLRGRSEIYTNDVHPRQPGRVLHAHGERFCS